MFYELLGRLTWKALKLYLHRHRVRTAIAAGAVVGGVVAAGVVVRRLTGSGGQA
ncbi:MAG: hypothetical protein IRZ32_10350 [Solirubrobacteraceae bacterium]|nr:hypothetical protein [Solirubrobacteraceae bacterium]